MATKVDSELMNMGLTQKAIVFNRDGKFLTLLRGKTAPSYPLRWDLPGGVVEYGEDLTESIIREVKEESGLEIFDVRPFDVHSRVHPTAGFWVTIAYRCRAKIEVVTVSWEHNAFKWVTKGEFLKLPASPKIIRFVENVFRTEK